MSATNHKRKIVTKKSGHMGHSFGPLDICKKPDKTLVLSDNYNPSSQLVGTVRTFVCNARIMTAKDYLDEPSMPMHDGTDGGIISGTYCHRTYPITSSPDLRAEGAGVVRTADLSFQNKNNAFGMFSIMTPADQARYARDMIAAKDKLIAITGVCSHGRPLDWPRGSQKTGEPVYLEVLNTDSVILTAQRINALEKGKPPSCESPEPHTKWVAQVSGPGVAPVTDIKLGTDIYEVPAGFFNVPGFEKPAPSESEPEPEFELHGPMGTLLDIDGVETAPHDQDDAEFRHSSETGRAQSNIPRVASEQARAQVDASYESSGRYTQADRARRQELENLRNSRGYLGTDRQTGQSLRDEYRRLEVKRRRYEQAYEARARTLESDPGVKDEAQRRMERYRDQRFRNSMLQGLITGAGSFMKAVQHWNALNNAPTITVTATACSGPKQATLKVLPAGKKSYDLFSDALSTYVEAINKCARFPEKAAEIFGGRGSRNWVIEAFVDPRVAIEIEYKELFRDSINGLTKGCVNRAWTLIIGFEKLIYCFIEFGIPLSRALAGCPPAAVIIGALEWLGVEGTFYFKAEAAIAVELCGIWNEYDEFDVAFQPKLKFEFQLGAKFRFMDYNEVAICGFAEIEVTADNPQIAKEAVLTFDFEASLQLGIKAWAHIDIWGFRHNWDFAWKPESAKFESGKQTMQLIRLS